MEGCNLKRREYDTVMSSEANEKGLEQLLKDSWRVALQNYFDKSMSASLTVVAYLAYPCVRTEL